MLRAARHAFLSGLVITLASGAIAAACVDVDPQQEAHDAGQDVPFIDAGGRENVSRDEDAAPISVPAADAAVAIDTSPPARVEDLAVTAETHAAVLLTWTAPADDSGAVTAYDVRFATTPIATLADFMAATSVAPPGALPTGAVQTIVVPGLRAATEYHFAVRARDAAGNFGLPSNDGVVTTKPRAVFLVSEIAPANTGVEGDDFVELVAIAAGSAAGLEVRHGTGISPSALLHQLAPLDVALGDRVVVHAMGLPAGVGFAQEDVAKNKTASSEPFGSSDAYDVYSPFDNLLGTGGVIAVVDGTAYQDAVAYSDRNTMDASPALMAAFSTAFLAGAWSFSSPPVDGTNDCSTLLEVANGNTSSSPPACGGYPGFLTAGRSLQRNGLVDTNSRSDFFVAEQTPGAANALYCAPEGATLAITEVGPLANLLELTVTHGGLLRGFSVRRDPRPGALSGTLLGTMPALCATTGDVVVLHVAAPNGSVSEVTAKDEVSAATQAGNYDGAWDVVQTSSSSALPFASSLVIVVRSPLGEYIEAAAFSSQTVTPTEGGTFHQSLAYVQGLGLWLPADCGGTVCNNTTLPAARDITANWNGVGSLASDASCGRSGPTSTREAKSWLVGPSTFGQ